MKKMKNGKSCGPDNTPIEAWKALGEVGVLLLTELFNMVLSTGVMPSVWRESVLTPIYKNKGDVMDCKNYRGIKLLCHIFKLYERIIDARLRALITPNNAHMGFLPGRGTTDAIFLARQIMEKHREKQRNLSLVFIDLEKAYDRIPREEIWRCLRLRGVPEYLVQTIMDMYKDSATTIKTAAGDTDAFKVRVGLHQGSALSPFLFVMLLNLLTEDLQLELPWTVVYADDVMLCMVETNELNIKLEDWRQALEDRGLRINRIKTECMQCMYEDENDEDDVDLEIDFERLKEVQTFKYLGSMISSDGNMEAEVTNRIQAGWASWRKCAGIMTDKRIDRKLKKRIYTGVIRPAMIYSAETWSTTKREEERMNVNEMRMLRWAAGVTRRDRVPNRYIRGSMKIAEISKKIMEKRLVWYGHIGRRTEDHYLKHVANIIVPGTRRRGRPKTRWKDCVARDMAELGLTPHQAQDRATWRRLVRSHCSNPV